MIKKVLIINGSNRVGGNTDMLLANLISGIKSTDVSETQYFLRNKIIKDCRGCYFCYKNGFCSTKDDMQEIHNEIQNSDLMILASPMYYWGVTGLMKTFIDRLYLYYPRRNRNLIAGKKAIIITPMNVDELEHGKKAFVSEIEPLTMSYKYILKLLGVEILDMIFYSGLRKKGDAKKNTMYISSAYKLGERLTSL